MRRARSITRDAGLRFRVRRWGRTQVRRSTPRSPPLAAKPGRSLPPCQESASCRPGLRASCQPEWRENPSKIEEIAEISAGRAYGFVCLPTTFADDGGQAWADRYLSKIPVTAL